MAIGGRKKLTPKPKGSKRSPSGVARTRARVVASAEKAAARKAGIAPTDEEIEVDQDYVEPVVMIRPPTTTSDADDASEGGAVGELFRTARELDLLGADTDPGQRGTDETTASDQESPAATDKTVITPPGHNETVAGSETPRRRDPSHPAREIVHDFRTAEDLRIEQLPPGGRPGSVRLVSATPGTLLRRESGINRSAHFGSGDALEDVFFGDGYQDDEYQDQQMLMTREGQRRSSRASMGPLLVDQRQANLARCIAREIVDMALDLDGCELAGGIMDDV